MNGSILTLLFSSSLNLFHLAVLIKNNKKEWRPGGLIKFKVKEENNVRIVKPLQRNQEAHQNIFKISFLLYFL